MTVNIEKNIPKPVKKIIRRGMEASPLGTVKFVWLFKMDVGDSVRFNHMKEAYAAQSAVYRLKKLDKLLDTFQIEHQRVVENDGEFVRVWRTA